MNRARFYAGLVSAIVWLLPAWVLAQNTPSLDAAKAVQLRTEIHQKLGDLAKAKAAEQPDQAKIQQIAKELQTLRAQLRQGGAAGAAAQAGQCPLGGPGLGLGLGRGPGFAGGNQGGPPAWAGGRGPCGQGLGPCGGACWNCPNAQGAPPANAAAVGGSGGRGGRWGGGRGYRGGR